MIRLITDSSCTYSKEEAKKMGFFVNPLQITMGDETFRDFEDITSEEFILKVKNGGIPHTSQPNVADLLEIFEAYPNDEFIYLSIADGLSGAYQSAMACKNMVENNERIHIVNTETLWGAQKRMVEIALEMIKNNFKVNEIIEKIKEMATTTKSYLMPIDYDFLKRGGRLNATAAMVASVIKLVPVVTLSPEGKSIDKFAIQRSMKKAISMVIEILKKQDITNMKIYLSHALSNEVDLEYARKLLKENFPDNEICDLSLAPSMISHGGPGCIAIQVC